MKQKPSVWEALHDGLVRTYGDLIRICRPSSEYGNCCACHKWGNGVGPLFHLSTRANICQQCCERKSDEVLGSILKAERAARRHIRNSLKRGEDPGQNVRFYAHLTRAPAEFIEAEIKRQRTTT